MDNINAQLSAIAVSLAETSASMKALDELIRRADERLTRIEEKSVETRIAVGKLEAKNGIIATITGAISGIISSKFGA